MLTKKEIDEIENASECQSLRGLWFHCIPDNVDDERYLFEERKILFFYILEKLLHEGRVKLAKNDNFLTESIEEQVKRFHHVFPENEQQMEDGIWFYDERCPVSVVWVLPDGTLDWN